MDDDTVAGGTWALPRLVGAARAAGLAMLGDKLPAEQAAAWGLIWKCVDDASFAGEIDAMAAQLATAATKGLALTKRALQASGQHSLDEQLDMERDLQRELGVSYLFITHNLAVVEYIADFVAVMQAGRIVEQGACADVLGRPVNDYTRTLLAAVPRLGPPPSGALIQVD